MEFSYRFDEVDMARFLFYSPKFRKSYLMNKAFMIGGAIVVLITSIFTLNQYLMDLNEPPIWGDPIPFGCFLIPFLLSLAILIVSLFLKQSSLRYLAWRLRKKGDPFGIYGKCTIRTFDECYNSRMSIVDQYISWNIVKTISRSRKQIVIELKNGTRTIIPEDSIEGVKDPSIVFEELFKRYQKRSPIVKSKNGRDVLLNKGSDEGKIMELLTGVDMDGLSGVVTNRILKSGKLTKYRILVVVMGLILIGVSALVSISIVRRGPLEAEDIVDLIVVIFLGLAGGSIALFYGFGMKILIGRLSRKFIEKWRSSLMGIQVISLHDWGVRVKSQFMDTSYSWELIEGIDETDEHLLLLMPKMNLLMVSKKDLEAVQLEEIKITVEKYTSLV